MVELTDNDKNGYCSNCRHSFENAEFCPKCGQKNTDGRISIKEFFSVVFQTVFNLESKLFQTIRDIFSPGKLTNEWFKGRHKPYFHPVRLFIVTALLLIAALSPFISEDIPFMTDDYEEAKRETYRKEFVKEIDNYAVLYLKDKKAKMVLDSLAKTLRDGRVNSGRKTMINYGNKNGLPDFKDKSPEEIMAYYKDEFGNELADSIINVIKSKRRLIQDSFQLINLVGDVLNHNISNEDFLDLTPAQIADKYQIEGFFKRLHFRQRLRLQKSGKNLFPFVLGNSLWVALLMMPFLAIILKLLYIRRDYYYVEHLIFSFHAHSFAFILFAIICIFMKTVYLHPLIVVFGFFVLFIYLYKSLRKVYKQGGLKTISKLLLANIVYLGLFLSFAMMGLVVSLFLF